MVGGHEQSVIPRTRRYWTTMDSACWPDAVSVALGRWVIRAGAVLATFGVAKARAAMEHGPDVLE